jgi:hypothetical protein
MDRRHLTDTLARSVFTELKERAPDVKPLICLDEAGKPFSNVEMGIMNGKKVLDDGRYFYLERV